MRSIRLFTLLLLTLSLDATAQTYPLFRTKTYLDIGAIRAAHLLHGDMWFDTDSNGIQCEFPKGSGKNVGYSATIWMGGFDANNVLHVAGQAYRTKGVDYWPGPIDTGTLHAVSYTQSQNWARIWKINRTEINSFLSISAHTAGNTPTSILEWPARGNPYARGAGGASIVVNHSLAPFIDVNGDGNYNPLQGDYPDMKGDQMLWWVINDTGATRHTGSGLPALGVDVAVSAYAYHGNDASDKIIYYEYQIKNHTPISYRKFRMGLYADLDIGYPFDDYFGFDSSRRLAITYNGKSQDGQGEPGSYGRNIPMAGIAIMEVPGDVRGALRPAGTLNWGMQYWLGDPGLKIYNGLSGYFDTIPPPTWPYYFYHAEDTECRWLNTQSNDRSFILAADSFTLNAGATTRIAFALIVADSAGGCPDEQFTGMNALTDSAYKYYWNTPPALAVTQAPRALRQPLTYPNPARATLYLVSPSGMNGPIRAFNTLGQAFELPAIQQSDKWQIDVSGLAPGLYTLRFNDGNAQRSTVFVKE